MSARWLALREPADRAARSTMLVTELRRHLPEKAPLVVHDLGCGTGSMLRWLAPLLPGPQRWTGHDRDQELLATLSTSTPVRDSHGGTVTVDMHACNLAELRPDELTGASLITASSLLDMLSAAELERLATACLAAECPLLLTLSVTGHVELRPSDRQDERIRHAFNAHQRRITSDGRTLLGPDAVPAAITLFAERGATVLSAPSVWQLRAGDRALINEWLTGWVGAACGHDPALARSARDYLRRRSAADGHLDVTVHHRDLLIMP
ncbi:MAG TPA: class I SAM-dependent methyltransferase [Jatrophihabitans sp.]|nr:class I SAM-dependent methyltransferase [Jatrophihabitans sp.]